MVSRGTVRVCQRDQTLTFQVQGRGTMHESPVIRRFVDKHLASGCQALQMDLRHCTYMDSTFLGTLLFLNRLMEDRPQGRLTLVSPSPQCHQLLHQMRLDRILPIVTEEEPTAGRWRQLTSQTEDARDFKRNVVEAHCELAELGGPAGDTFRELASHMARDLERDDQQ